MHILVCASVILHLGVIETGENMGECVLIYVDMYIKRKREKETEREREREGESESKI